MAHHYISHTPRAYHSVLKLFPIINIINSVCTALVEVIVVITTGDSQLVYVNINEQWCILTTIIYIPLVLASAPAMS